MLTRWPPASVLDGDRRAAASAAVRAAARRVDSQEGRSEARAIGRRERRSAASSKAFHEREAARRLLERAQAMEREVASRRAGGVAPAEVDDDVDAGED